MLLWRKKRALKGFKSLSTSCWLFLHVQQLKADWDFLPSQVHCDSWSDRKPKTHTAGRRALGTTPPKAGRKRKEPRGSHYFKREWEKPTTSDCRCERHLRACLFWAQTAVLFYLIECQIHQNIKIMRCTKWWTDLYLMKTNVIALIPIHSATFTVVLWETAD